METADRLWRDRVARWLWLAAALALLAPGAAGARAEPRVYLFWSAGCPHCEREIAFLQRLQRAQPSFELRAYEITGNPAHLALFRTVVETFGIAEPAVPLTVIGDRVWVGYAGDGITGREMRERIAFCAAQGCPDRVAALAGGRPPATAPPAEAVRGPLPDTLRLPLLGTVPTRSVSLPLLTVALGALDGFNPCAMWTLLFLIGLLLGIRDPLRMWTLGGVFIVGSAAVYFAFLAAWLNLLLFLGELWAIRAAIGAVALGGGAYYLRRFILDRDAVCPVTAPASRQRILQRLRDYAGERNFLLALCGILALAVVVNLAELLCSAGIPAVYTQILAMHALPAWQYYGYLLLYVLVFMADDLLVFFAAMQTLRVSGLTTRYARYSHLVGGVLLVAIGVLLLLRPQWLAPG